MKKTFYAAVLLLTIGIAATSCKKDNTPKIKTENPAKATIAAALVVDSAALSFDGSWEFGQKLYFSKNGKITKLGCRMGNKGSFRVSLWDFTTKNLIAATTVNVTDTTQFIYNTVADIAVTANTRYVISLNTTEGATYRQYWAFFKKSNTAIIFPYTTGSVTYESNQYSSSTSSVFPLIEYKTRFILGVPDFQFEYTE